MYVYYITDTCVRVCVCVCVKNRKGLYIESRALIIDYYYNIY